ncbi:hypothetical protein HZA56_00590 [Candidatus Poribacteria bacterium]|nr:hypothetical protein [Candidatus Poribacteria bacterium]
MAIPKNNVRGLQNIRTFSGAAESTHEPYRAYMKVTCLEMEKARRKVERDNAISTMRNIDARLQEIEAEKARLLQTSAEQRQQDIEALPNSSPRRGNNAGAFRLKY